MRGLSFIAIAAILAGCAMQPQGNTGPDLASVARLRPLAIYPQPPAEGEQIPSPDPTGPLDDEVTCLARTVYWEAKGEGLRGMNAVAHVVLNRVSSEQYPDDVCAVIKDGGRIGPCQFSWYCDTRPNAAREEDAYADAQMIAWQALKGESHDPTAGATMFHNPSVKPRWARVAKRTAVIGNHAFYRLD